MVPGNLIFVNNIDLAYYSIEVQPTVDKELVSGGPVQDSDVTRCFSFMATGASRAGRDHNSSSHGYTLLQNKLTRGPRLLSIFEVIL